MDLTFQRQSTNVIDARDRVALTVKLSYVTTPWFATDSVAHYCSSAANWLVRQSGVESVSISVRPVMGSILLVSALIIGDGNRGLRDLVLSALENMVHGQQPEVSSETVTLGAQMGGSFNIPTVTSGSGSFQTSAGGTAQASNYPAPAGQDADGGSMIYLGLGLVAVVLLMR